MAVVALTGAAAYTCYRYNDKLADMAKKSVNYVSDHAKVVGTKIANKTKNAWTSTKDLKSYVSDHAKIAGTKMANGTKNAWTKVKTVGANIVSKAKESFNTKSVNHTQNVKNYIFDHAKASGAKIVNETKGALNATKIDEIKIVTETPGVLNTTKAAGTKIAAGAKNVCLLTGKTLGTVLTGMKKGGQGMVSLAKGAYHHKGMVGKCYLGVTSAVGTYTIINGVADKTSKIKKSVNELASTTGKIVKFPIKTVSVLKSGVTKSVKAVKCIAGKCLKKDTNVKKTDEHSTKQQENKQQEDKLQENK